MKAWCETTARPLRQRRNSHFIPTHAIETEPTDFDMIQSSFDDLKTAIDNFVKGEKVRSCWQSTLKDGIKLPRGSS